MTDGIKIIGQNGRYIKIMTPAQVMTEEAASAVMYTWCSSMLTSVVFKVTGVLSTGLGGLLGIYVAGFFVACVIAAGICRKVKND